MNPKIMETELKIIVKFKAITQNEEIRVFIV